MNAKGCKWIKVGLVNSLLLLSIGTGVCKTVQPVAAKETSLEAQVEPAMILNASQPVSALDAQADEAILKRTVQIKMYIPLPAEDPDLGQSKVKNKAYLLSRGLGSLVVWRGQKAIVTHNHWGNTFDEVEYVQILDRQGKQLIKLGKDKFMSLILYSDPGTLVLHDPIDTWVTLGSLGDENSVSNGDFVTVAHQDPDSPGKIDLMQAKVVSQPQQEDLPVLQLVALNDGAIVPGDSGGGVWLDGKPIGNTWAVVTGSDKPVPSDVGLAAMLPSIAFEADVVDLPSTPGRIISNPIMQ